MTPPHDLDAEAALLGAMMLRRDAIEAARAAGLRPAHYYSPSHREIAVAVDACYDAAIACDPVTVADQLRRRDKFDEVGGAPKLMGLQAGCPSIGGAARYAEIVREMAERRELMAWAEQVGEAAADLSVALVDVRGMVETMVWHPGLRVA